MQFELAHLQCDGLGRLLVNDVSACEGAVTPATVGLDALETSTRLDMAFGEIALDPAVTEQSADLEKRLGFLATIGSAGPFVGLFGTVWGITNAFTAIASAENTSLAVVAPGIAEALLATALVLLAAIPAVIAYNKLSADKRGRATGAMPRLRNIPATSCEKLRRALRSINGPRGAVVVRFTVLADGRVSGVGIGRSSGNAAVDQAWLATVSRAAPFPPIPAEANRSDWTFDVPLAFGG